jgi:hypothetical protein
MRNRFYYKIFQAWSAALLLALLLQCGAGSRKSEPPEKKPQIIEKKPRQEEVPEPVPTAIDYISTQDGRVGWSGIFIGHQLETIQSVMNTDLKMEETILSTCGGASADATFKERELWLQFTGMAPGSKLESMLVVFNSRESKFSADQLKTYLKSHLPEVVYQPSHHREDLSEEENQTPVYLLPDNREMAILLKPGEGFYLAYSICLD